jgi:hypothetical protein
VIEFSTLGPGERKLLKQRRIQNASKREGGSNIDDKFSLRSFQAAKERDCKMNSEDVNMELGPMQCCFGYSYLMSRETIFYLHKLSF